MQPLEPLTFPLAGRQLIEASAGTGKTYTIVLLYLRLLLEKRLPVDEILVVTFTRAATEELRDRIRSRIREALDLLEQRPAAPSDPLLEELLARAGREDGATLLKDALARMDEAAIHTIHGFCQRVLQDHAVESGISFDTEFLENEILLRQQIMEDFWRSRFYGLEPTEAAWILAQWEGPGKLLEVLSGPMLERGVRCFPAIDRQELDDLRQTCLVCFREIQQAWPRARKEVAEALSSATGLSRDKRKKAYSPERVEQALAGMDQLADEETLVWQLPPATELLAQSVMDTKMKKKGTRAEHRFFTLFDQFYIAHSRLLSQSRIAILIEARDFMLRELEQRKKEQDAMYFDDLLHHLDKALQRASDDRMVRRIRTRFPVAMVDEFQDTDPVQYQIFKTIYARRDDRCGLFMIGDPKQAIYSFRGADIFTYIQARRDTPPQHRFTIGTNYRSTSTMVEAVNHLFGARDSFIFSRDIRLHPVQAAGRIEKEKPLLVDGAPLPAMEFLVLPTEELAASRSGGVLAREKGREAAAALCAARISRLLAAGLGGRALIGAGTRVRPLASGDIAVLVRTHREAAVVQRALAAHNIVSVCYSQESVFSSPEAEHLLHLLLALENPEDEGLVRLALVSPLFGLDAADIDRLGHDEAAWEERLAMLQEYRQRLEEHGPVTMLQYLVAREGVTSRLLQPASGPRTVSGERQLTNYMHLAELLQEAWSRAATSVAGLVRWFDQQLQTSEAEKKGESQQLRLESDENLVRIVTIHKAKGLQYSLVFLPFLWDGKVCERNRPFAFHDPQTLVRQVDLGSGDEDHYRQAEQERLAEDLRLLYVAMTRAVYGTVVCWGRFRSMEHSALAYLLHRDTDGRVVPVKELSRDRIMEELHGLARRAATRAGDQRVITVAQVGPEEMSAQEAVCVQHTSSAMTMPAEVAPRVFTGHVDIGWRITSYSGLVSGHEVELERAEYHEPMATDPVGLRNDAVPEEVMMTGRDRFGFPRGPEAGTCLHGILEEFLAGDSNTPSVDTNTPSVDTNTPSVDTNTLLRLRRIVTDQLGLAGIDAGWAEMVTDWMKQVVTTPLVEGLTLARLEPGSRTCEMGFYFSLDGLRIDRWNEILEQYGMAPLPEKSGILRGLMKGYIDLVFRGHGRFWVVDYKSNFLGSGLEEYRPDRLHRAMLEHRYDLQYLIYILALHRYLRTRLADYEYDIHMGGALYLFLRGMAPDNPPGTGIFHARPQRDLIESLDLACQGRAPGVD
ncbi:exodeoxyribonuclease V subunit beta [Desulfolithobacter sp.]